MHNFWERSAQPTKTLSNILQLSILTHKNLFEERIPALKNSKCQKMTVFIIKLPLFITYKITKKFFKSTYYSPMTKN